jgi:hypothetical protein
MDQLVPSSQFIPKKTFVPVVPPKKRPIGLVLLLSLIIFFASVGYYAFQYVYNLSLQRQIDSLKASIGIQQSKFEAATLQKLTKTDGKISAVKEILSKHTSLVPLFNLLDTYTLQSVRFRGFSFSVDPTAGPEIHITGDAAGYASIALQSDSFNTSGKLKNIVFSDLNLDQNGRVLFTLNASVDPTLLSVAPVANTSNASSTGGSTAAPLFGPGAGSSNSSANQ